ncbi:MAG TPA: hypothetical protein DCM31_00155, partial [Deferribacteraceae bacterium]|nr:hypothetical protein [Deferribacteraceae bacterium]
MAYTDFTTTAKLAAIYVGYFGRAADPEGFVYWEDDFATRVADGATEQDALIAVAQSFANDTEAQATYSYLADPDTGDVGAFIDAIYQNLFGHAADAAGKDYWTGYLSDADAGELTVGKFILAVMEGAIGTDLTVLENRAAVSEYYAANYDADVWENNPTFLAEARNILSGVTDDPSTVEDAKADVDVIISGGETFTLTEAIEAAATEE